MTVKRAHGGGASSTPAATSTPSPKKKLAAKHSGAPPKPPNEPAPSTPAAQLTQRLCHLHDNQIVEMYVRMIRDRDYQPINELGPNLWDTLTGTLTLRDILTTIGAHCRARLGVDG